jgi:protein SCO1/2
MREQNLKIIALVVTLITFFIFYLVLRTTITPKQDENYINSKIENKAADIGGEFNLTDSSGEHFSSDQLKGKPALIYFGFTFCPDVCVTSLQKINQVLKTLDLYKININPVFITLDPKRDTSSTLKNYFSFYHPKFIALTGTKEQIKEAADKYRVYYAIRGDENSNDYLVDHSTFIYLFNKEGKYITHFTIDSKVEEIVEYIRVNCRE